MKILITEQQFQKLITERHSVSDKVKTLSDFIFDKIKEDLPNREMCRSIFDGIKVKEGSIVCDLFEIGPQFDNVQLHYTIYFPKDDIDIRLLNEKYLPQLNSSYDNETNELVIVTWIYKGEFAYDAESSVYHELTHLYQYRMGMEKRVSLYDAVIELQNNKKIPSYARYVGLAIYYTFPHEQDAFTHQYYALLKDGYDIKPTEFGYFKRFKDIYEILLDYQDNGFVLDAIKSLGFSISSFFQRLDYSLKRFQKKLTNACTLNYYEEKEEQISETVKFETDLKRRHRFYESNDNDMSEFDIKFIKERFYNI